MTISDIADTFCIYACLSGDGDSRYNKEFQDFSSRNRETL